MYQLAVKRDFIAQHFLIGGDWGPESDLHSHHYQVEIILEGESLNEHGYLVDIVEVEQQLELIIDRYRDNTLNSLAEFEGLNPSLEHFVRLFALRLAEQLASETVSALAIKIWENDIAWASYRLDLTG